MSAPPQAAARVDRATIAPDGCEEVGVVARVLFGAFFPTAAPCNARVVFIQVTASNRQCNAQLVEPVRNKAGVQRPRTPAALSQMEPGGGDEDG